MIIDVLIVFFTHCRSLVYGKVSKEPMMGQPWSSEHVDKPSNKLIQIPKCVLTIQFLVKSDDH